jgi:hypothetical protein
LTLITPDSMLVGMSMPPQPPPIPTPVMPYAHASEQRHRITMAIVCLHISAVLYLGLALLALWFPHLDTPVRALLLIVCLGLVVVIEVIVWGLHKRYYWAWIAGLCLFAIYAPSLFFILGGLGLWGLLDPGSRAQFGVGRR